MTPPRRAILGGTRCILHFDVIVVGGRPTGASLATRLGRRGLRVLVLERARMPSMPIVPTCPTLHMGTLALLDELGLPEEAYARDATRFERIIIDFEAVFRANFPFPSLHGRAHAYSVDRRHFDRVLWEHMAATPGVDARQGVAVDEVLRDADGRVRGVRAGAERFDADWVVGADGRFSGVARQVGAEVVERRAEHVSTVYFADWEGLDPAVPGEDVVQIHATGKGANVLFFPLPGRVTVCTHERADRVSIEGDATAWYEARLAGMPAIAARMTGAKRVGRVVGLKRVGNGYRRAAGPGWALAGDAVHFKDPVDGQGIYDALLTTRILAEELCAGGDVGARYTERMRAATHPMFRATTQRLHDELYREPPALVVRTLLRWSLQDPTYQRRFFGYLCRELDPDGWLPPSVMAGAAARGLGRDVARWFS